MNIGRDTRNWKHWLIEPLWRSPTATTPRVEVPGAGSASLLLSLSTICEAWGSYHLAPQPNQEHLLPDRGGMALLLTSGLNVRLCSETSGDVGSDQKVVVLGGFARVAGPFV